MKKILICLCCLSFFVFPVSAMDFQAPTAPDIARKYINEETESFSEGLWYIICRTISTMNPEIRQACTSSILLVSIALLTSISSNFIKSGSSIFNLIATISVSSVLIKSANSYISLGISTVQQLSEYGNSLLPVMTAAMAAGGGTTTAAANYAATAMFDAILCNGISKIMIPMLYIFLCLSITRCVTEHDAITQIKNVIKWLITWVLKISLYVFTGYLTVTGIVSGSVDSSVLKAAKITLSGAVPVVGNIISDASEAILVSVSLMKNAAGVYGILTLFAVFLSPFLTIGLQHMLLKITAGICKMFGSTKCVDLILDFSTVMGFLLAMTGTVCLLHLIGTVCFMKGVV